MMEISCKGQSRGRGRRYRWEGRAAGGLDTAGGEGADTATEGGAATVVTPW